MKTIALLGTMDTKGQEFGFLAEKIRIHGYQTLVIDVGSERPPLIPPDISRETVAALAGLDWPALAARHDRGECVAAMSKGAAMILLKLHAEGRIDAVISLGGGGGTAIATAGMQALPIGFPKVMVSTLASGDTSRYVGVKDIVMFPSIVDIAGLNRISRLILSRAAGAICGMAAVEISSVTSERSMIAASMFGNTTDCINHAKSLCEQAGFEVLVFHATGTGGKTMESLIEAGMFAGVLDITTTEWADELVGGILRAGPTRLDAAGKVGLPAVIAPGCLDMANFGARDSVPAAYSDRRFYQHNPQITLMRTTPEENTRLGEILANKINAYTGPVTVALPLQAISVISAEGGPFYWPEADAALFASIKAHLKPEIKVMQIAAKINDPVFASACATELLAMIAR